MPDYRALAQALDPYAMDTGGITPDTIKALKTINKSPNLLGMIGDIGRGGLSNLESLVRGGVAQFGGTPVDTLNTIRTPYPMEVMGDVNYAPDKQVYGGTKDILGMMPKRVTQARPETAGMEELGTVMGPGLAKGVAPAVKAYGRLAGEALANEARIPILSDITPKPLGIVGFDLRYDPRIKEQERLKALITQVQQTQSELPQKLSLADLEGRPFITSMSDRTAGGGILTGINDVQLNRPIELQGGQDYMFNNPGQVWASAQAPVKQILENAQVVKQVTGQNPLYIPWRMAPTGGDFAHMTGETMLSYADTVMNKGTKAKVNKEIKKLIPEWSGLGTDEAIVQYRDAPDKTRKALKNMMDVEFRDRGGLNIGEARLAVSDPTQLSAQDAGIQNIGEIFADKPMIMQSGHVSYPRGVPGQGLGVAAEDRNIFELLPQVVKERGIANPLQPSQTDIRALQMKPYAGMITHDLLKALGY